MLFEKKIIYLLILLHTQGLGRVKIKKLIHDFGSIERVIEEGWEPSCRMLFRKYPVLNWEKDLEEAEKNHIQLISYMDENYPQALLSIADFPLILYVKGRLLKKENETLAVIGTRHATLYGKQIAEKISSAMGQQGVCIVSGLARGIDTAAHEGALKGEGQTIAVIGSGLSQIYPKENQGLAERIAESGAVISELPLQTYPAKGFFPQRNRIVSGLAKGVCLIESSFEGGGMITMRYAEQQKKLLFAVPGRVDWPTFSGNHFLIKQKKAELIENSEDLIKYFKTSQVRCAKNTSLPPLTVEESAFLDKIPQEEKTIEELVLLTQLPIMQLNVLLTRLVLKKVMKEFPGKIYKKE